MIAAIVGAVGTTLSISRLEIVATAELPATSVAVTRTSYVPSLGRSPGVYGTIQRPNSSTRANSVLAAENELPDPISILMSAPGSPFPVNQVNPSSSTLLILSSVAMAFAVIEVVVSSATLKPALSATATCVTVATLPAMSVIFVPDALTSIASAGILIPPASFCSSEAIV